MRLSRLLRLQFIYVLIGILFNVVSWIMLIKGNSPLTPTLPLGGIIAMLIYGLFLFTGYFNKIGWYRFLMMIATIVFAYGGIVKHLIALNQTPELYYSIFSGILGILINVFGFILNLLAVLRKFTFEK